MDARTSERPKLNVATRNIDRPANARGAEYIIIESVTPEVDGGRYPAKRIIGDIVSVGADLIEHAA